MKNRLKIVIPVIIAAAAIITAALCINFTPEEKTDFDSLLSTAQKYLIENHYEQAIAEFEKVIELDPMNVEAYLGIAEAYEGLGDYEMAEKMRSIAANIMAENTVLQESESTQSENESIDMYIDENELENDLDEYDENGVLRHKFNFYFYPDIVSHEYFYNDNGILIKEILYNEQGSMTEIREYDINGFLFKTILYLYEGDNITLRLTQESEYFENSNKAKIRRWFRKGITIEDEWTYDIDGVEIQSKRYNDDGILTQVRDCKNINGKSIEIKWTNYWEGHITEETFFNDDGLETHSISYYEDGSVSYKSEHEIQNGKSLIKNNTAYTEDGRIIMTHDYENINGECVSGVYKNYYSDNSVSLERFENSDGKKTKEIKYYKNGNIKEITDYNIQNGISVRRQWVWYDENGELKRKIYYDENGNIID